MADAVKPTTGKIAVTDVGKAGLNSRPTTNLPTTTPPPGTTTPPATGGKK
jgi:hypothetical protein